MATTSKNMKSSKKSMLKKLVKSASLKGSSPIKMDNGLGKTPLITTPDAITGGGGSNLGTNGIF